ncbi:MAG: Rpn family recombination-promoting nuclease/putative transposase, partial [Oscillospiraceae bacterium]|jgi:hypothetical protein|nr:Rpn family recombination-promoting nuclease/putative transposase [Oscillospiraceae bacterium]
MLFYATQAIARETGTGTKFENLPRVTVISLADFDVRKESEDIHQPISVRWEKDPQTRATDLIDLHVIELKKARRRLKTLTEALKAGDGIIWQKLTEKMCPQRESPRLDRRGLSLWLCLLSCAHSAAS